MVCAKCQKLQKKTELATPAVKRKNEMYYGSPTLSNSVAGSKPSATLGSTGIGKVSVPVECANFRCDASTDRLSPEQTTKQKRKEPLCCIFELMYYMQDEGGSRTQVLPPIMRCMWQESE
ncbi:hypothetical protein MMC28_002462 [Mycoblastus sanguinarius]|nr:hypothetical protein [Mycoblastus sanguinarius]